MQKHDFRGGLALTNKTNTPGLLILGLFLITILLTNSFIMAQTPPTNGLAACQHYASQWYKQENPDAFEGLTLSAQSLDEEKYEGNVGSQFVSTVLSGTGQWRFKGEKPGAMQFTCLLENDRKAVFFHARQSPKPDPAQTCWNNFHPGDWGGLQHCLQQALIQKEAELAQRQAQAQAWAKKVDIRWPQAQAVQALSSSNRLWQAYRNQECARRDAFRTGGNHPDVTRYECLIHKTNERIQDLQSEE